MDFELQNATKMAPETLQKNRHKKQQKKHQFMNLSQHRTGSALKKLRRRRELGVG